MPPARAIVGAAPAAAVDDREPPRGSRRPPTGRAPAAPPVEARHQVRLAVPRRRPARPRAGDSFGRRMRSDSCRSWSPSASAHDGRDDAHARLPRTRRRSGRLTPPLSVGAPRADRSALSRLTSGLELGDPAPRAPPPQQRRGLAGAASAGAGRDGLDPADRPATSSVSRGDHERPDLGGRAHVGAAAQLAATTSATSTTRTCSPYFSPKSIIAPELAGVGRAS